jgi:hypothetical protein
MEVMVLFALLFGGLWWAGGRGGAKAVFFIGGGGDNGGGFLALRNYARHWPSVLRHRGAVLSAALLLAATSTLVLFKATERDFQTSGALDEFVVFVELSSGAKLDVSNAVVADIERVLARDPEVAPGGPHGGEPHRGLVVQGVRHARSPGRSGAGPPSRCGTCCGRN